MVVGFRFISILARDIYIKNEAEKLIWMPSWIGYGTRVMKTWTGIWSKIDLPFGSAVYVTNRQDSRKNPTRPKRMGNEQEKTARSQAFRRTFTKMPIDIRIWGIPFERKWMFGVNSIGGYSCACFLSLLISILASRNHVSECVIFA